MPNFDNKIQDRTIGDAFDITRIVGGVGSVSDAYLTVMPQDATDTSTTNLFQKHITTSAGASGIIDGATTYTVTADGSQRAGTSVLIVQPLPTVIVAGVVLQFPNAWCTVTETALQGATAIKVDLIDGPIANVDTATYKIVRLKFKVTSVDSALLTPNKSHFYDIEIIDGGDPATVEDGTFNLRPQRTQ